MSLESSVRDALDNVDTPTAQLALTYAKAIDEMPPMLPDLGPKLLAALDALLLTPKAKAAVMKGAKDDSPAASPIDELRGRRAARQRAAEAVDATAS